MNNTVTLGRKPIQAILFTGSNHKEVISFIQAHLPTNKTVGLYDGSFKGYYELEVTTSNCNGSVSTRIGITDRTLLYVELEEDELVVKYIFTQLEDVRDKYITSQVNEIMLEQITSKFVICKEMEEGYFRISKEIFLSREKARQALRRRGIFYDDFYGCYEQEGDFYRVLEENHYQIIN